MGQPIFRLFSVFPKTNFAAGFELRIVRVEGDHTLITWPRTWPHFLELFHCVVWKVISNKVLILVPAYQPTNLCTAQPVWPDGRIKSSTISSKVAKNVDTIVLTLKMMLFKMSKQLSKCLGYFCNKISCWEIYYKSSPNILKNRPIWSRCIQPTYPPTHLCTHLPTYDLFTHLCPT